MPRGRKRELCYSVAQAAELLGVTEQRVGELLRSERDWPNSTLPGSNSATLRAGEARVTARGIQFRLQQELSGDWKKTPRQLQLRLDLERYTMEQLGRSNPKGTTVEGL